MPSISAAPVGRDTCVAGREEEAGVVAGGVAVKAAAVDLVEDAGIGKGADGLTTGVGIGVGAIVTVSEIDGFVGDPDRDEL